MLVINYTFSVNNILLMIQKPPIEYTNHRILIKDFYDVVSKLVKIMLNTFCYSLEHDE